MLSGLSGRRNLWVCLSLSSGPPAEGVRFKACVDLSGELEAVEIDYGDVVIAWAGDEGTMAVGSTMMPEAPILLDGNALDELARVRFEDDEIFAAMGSDEQEASVWGKSETVCADGTRPGWLQRLFRWRDR